MAKPDISKVMPTLARQALINAKGDRKRAFSEYIRLMYMHTGRLAPECDNKDLQAFYDKECEHDVIWERVNMVDLCMKLSQEA